VRPRRGRPLVLLDVNALLLPFRARFPLREEVERLRPGAELVVPTSVLGELDALAERRVNGARPARELAGTFRELAGPGRGDDGIVRAAVGTGGWVATADRELARRLVARGITVLAPRDRSRLELHRGGPGRPDARRSPAGRSRRTRPPRPAARVMKRSTVER
jgi:rRNA-processing protein FCF1